MQELRSIASSNKSVKILQIDLKEFDKYPEIVAQVQDVVKEEGLNVLFNSAGISPRSSFLGLKALKPNELMDVFAVNCVAPLMLAKAFVPLLKKASDANKSAPLGAQRAAIVNMSESEVSTFKIPTKTNLWFQARFSAPLHQTKKALSIIIDLRSQD